VPAGGQKVSENQVKVSESQSPVIYIVDDDRNVAGALARLVHTAGFEVESYSSVDEFMRHYKPHVPGCVILDVSLGDWNGLDLQRTLAAEGHPRSTIFISGRSEIHTGVQAMKLGAVDFLTKPVRSDDLFQAIHTALKKDRQSIQEYEEKKKLKQRLTQLTPREYEVFRLVIHGRLNKQIAYQLGITEKTAKVHRARVMSKMGVRSVAELVHTCDELISVQNRAM
jgi:RNA polymerase sigma factor (sigma-70 family)